MCNLYRIQTTQEAMRRMFNVTNDRLGNLPLLDSVFPDQMAPVIRQADERLAETMRWGFPPPPKGNRPVTNVRNLKSSFWRNWLNKPEQRCLVPVTAFCEYEGERGAKVKRWFTIPGDEPLFAFAGIWRPWTGERGKETGEHLLFSFLTCEPNAVVAPIHPKAMPVMLSDPSDYETWLTADWDTASALVRSYPSDETVLLD